MSCSIEFVNYGIMLLLLITFYKINGGLLFVFSCMLVGSMKVTGLSIDIQS